jgi:hypothetical protein
MADPTTCADLLDADLCTVDVDAGWSRFAEVSKATESIPPWPIGPISPLVE